jgi:hypothetical protein
MQIKNSLLLERLYHEFVKIEITTAKTTVLTATAAKSLVSCVKSQNFFLLLILQCN